MGKHPLSAIEENDSALYGALSGARELAFRDGAIPARYKLLTALALDAAHGAANGVRALAQQALAAGATKDEIFETLRVVYHICGAGSVYTASAGLGDILDGPVL